MLEHMTLKRAKPVEQLYLHPTENDGELILICQQQASFKNHANHVEFFDFPKSIHLWNNSD